MSLYSNQCTIERQTRANTNGVMVPTWASLATGQRCLRQMKAGSLKQGLAGRTLEYDAVLFVPPSVDIRPQKSGQLPDRVTITTPANGEKYLVQFVSDRSGKRHHLTCYLKQYVDA